LESRWTTFLEQTKALEEIREAFKDAEYPEKGRPSSTFALNDYTYIKFLRARDYDVKKASKILRDHLAFRNKFNPEQVTSTSPGVIIEAKLMGKSRLGHPVLVYNMGAYEPTRHTKDTFLMGRLFEMELAKRDCAAGGWKVDRMIAISDFSGYSLTKHATFHALMLNKLMIDVVQSLYRDSLECCIVYNAPSPFWTAWKMIKVWIKPDTAKRVFFTNSLEDLQKYISADELWEVYGGTKKPVM